MCGNSEHCACDGVFVAIGNFGQGEMRKKVLIVEDEFIVALNLRQVLANLGFEVVGIAPDAPTAYVFAESKPDIALVDVNLRDGETGPEIGQTLAQQYGATVLFLTANPAQLGDGVQGALGVLSKPVDDYSIETVLDFLVKYQDGESTPPPPPSLRIFNNIGAAG